MTKLKSPLLSLGAKGTLGEAITFRESRGTSIAEKKPIPAYRRTLPQVYQRWLYEDYAHLWTLQSAATKAEYRAVGSIYHLTGFQYWMKYNLKALPDIAAIWHLDYLAGGVAPDSSRNSNDVTVLGPSLAAGRIDGCLSFDGVNDRGEVPNHASMNMGTQDFSVEFWCNLTDPGRLIYVIRKLVFGGPGWHIMFRDLDFRLQVWSGVNFIDAGIPHGGLWGAWHHVVYNLFHADRTDIYKDGTYTGNINTAVVTGSLSSAISAYISTNVANRGIVGRMDNIILRTRTLAPSEIAMKALRRYP